VETSDGGFIIAGSAWLPGKEYASNDVYVVKTNGAGILEWTRSYAHTPDAGYDDSGAAIAEVSTGGYVIAGRTNEALSKAWLIRIDSVGEVVWDETYSDGFGINLFTSVREIDDGGFVVAGTFGSHLDYAEIALVRTDETGCPIWTKLFGGVNDDNGTDVRVLPDGGFIMSGYTSSLGAGLWDMLLVRTDASGEEVWSKTHGSAFDDRAYGVAVGSDAIVAAGWAWTLEPGFADVHLAAFGDPSLGCAGDFNGDGALDILDFVALQIAFTAGDGSADINGDGALNILDFVAFQALFQQGCI
jgi:hypothetical protein